MTKVLFIGMEKSLSRAGAPCDTTEWRTAYSKIEREYDNLIACRMSAMISNKSYGWTRQSFRQSKVFDSNTKEFLGIIYSVGWYTKNNGIWYRQFLDSNGKIDTGYPKRKLGPKLELFKI